MILSRSCDHAIRASLYIALQADRAFVPIREIASALEISFHFLTKILQLLTQARIMASFKGPNGGVTLARPAAAISLKEIVLAIDGNRIFNGCMIGLDHCDDDHPCPIHDQWSGLRSNLEQLFSATTLADLAERVCQDGFRLTDLHSTEAVKS
ncbi:MAG TPA: Rrf2 family transcriptional regulator [bacterium]|nr:Rrf2 family transcriptional regulator [bacterium]HQI50334.1 Rrf2 family transcriptional regulator [bacterium]HQJ64403.1 Rrf2 family transcriptional regulator [bacterium]HQJ65515.1 Rrf2 family transcriptional regulator [bacterium]